MKHFELQGQVRQASNKAAIKAFRREGLVPCNLYGKDVENVLFTVSEKDLKGLTHTPETFIVDITLSDGSKHTAILHELQYHPTKDNCLHADFLAVSENRPIAIKVPIRTIGHSIGVKAGGKFFQSCRELLISALMKDLPDFVEVDITKLRIGKQISAGELSYDNITILTPKATIICRVKATRNMAATAVEEGEEESE